MKYRNDENKIKLEKKNDKKEKICGRKIKTDEK